MDGNYPGNVAFPPQKLPISKKNDKWKEQCVGSVIAREGGYFLNGVSRFERMKINYDLYNGIFNENDLKYVTNPFKVEDGFPAAPQNFNIIRQKINLLIGEETKRPFNFRVIQTNDSSATETESKIKDLLADYVIDNAIKLSKGQELDDNAKAELDSAIKYIKNEYYSPHESIAVNTLSYLKEKLNIQNEYVKGWGDLLIGGEEVYYIGIVNGEPYMERVNPMYFTYDRDPDLKFIEDGDWCVRRMPMSPSAIYDRFYDIMEESDLDALLEMSGGDNLNRSGSDVNFNRIVYKDILMHDLRRDENYKGVLINVWHVQWKSYKKVGFLKTFDENGEEYVVLVDETYKVNKEAGEEVEWDWVVEVWEGYRIGNNLFIGIKPVEYQNVSIDNPNSKKLSYTGGSSDKITLRSKSLVEVMKPLQYMYIIIWYRLELALARDKGKIINIDITQIPKSMGIDIPKWMHYISSLGVNFVNPYEEGWNVPGREGGKSSQFSQFGSVDLSMSNVILGYIQLMDKIEAMIGDISGITKQREGSISTNELVGSVERSVLQSSYITEPLFWVHNQYKKRALNLLLDVAKYAWKYSGKKKIQYFLNDYERIVLNISDDFLYSDFDIFVSDSTKEHQNLEKLQQMAQPAMQNGASMLDIVTIMTSESVSEIKSKLKEVEDKREEMMRRQQQMEMESIQKEQETDIALKQEELRIKEEDNIRKAEVQLAIKQLDVDNRDIDTDIDNDGDSDRLEFSKLNLQAKKITMDNSFKVKKLLEDIRSNRVKEKQKDREISIKSRQKKSTNK